MTILSALLCTIPSLIYACNVPFESYFFIFITVLIPVIISGIKDLRIQEKNRILLERQITLKKEQLKLFNDQELEYQKLCKWNHDIENHLLSMHYLMENGQYDEASVYLKSLIYHDSQDQQ